MKQRRFDTLAWRLFVLIWLTLLASHLAAVTLTLPLGQWLGLMTAAEALPAPWRQPPAGLQRPPHLLPPLASVPPGNPFEVNGPSSRADGAAGAGPRWQLTAPLMWLDYTLRALVIALGAALGARWLALPMRRLSRAAGALSAELSRGKAPAELDERHGTVEVRAAAAAFNGMARRLQEQFDARGMQMAALSHDLRTPLTRLRMRLDKSPPALAAAASADIHEMSEMMDSTLAVLREQRDGAPPGPVDLRSLLEAIVDDLCAGGADLHLAPGPAPRVLARPAALRRVVHNLVDNALRYGGRAELSLDLHADHVALHVDDSGPGIAADQLEQAFKPWVRLSPDGHARAGHGLGLAIARDLAERDGAQLTLANRAQGGLRATLCLPLLVSAPIKSA